MTCLSSAIFGGGLKKNVRSIANVTLPKDLNVAVEQMPDYSRTTLEKIGHSGTSGIVLLTTVPQQYLGLSRNGRCLVTAGLGNACSLIPDNIWDEKKERELAYAPGTINCILVLEDSLEDSALVEGYGLAKMTIMEILQKWSIFQRRPACVGTPTDCLALLCPQQGLRLKFAGLGTKVGADIVQMVREATTNALKHRYPDFRSE